MMDIALAGFARTGFGHRSAREDRPDRRRAGRCGVIFGLYAVCLALLTLTAGPVLAEPAPFDLVGPTLRVKVTHAGVTLPIAETPNLSAGDQLWIKADLPSAQSAHYLLVAAFLRGATNPPPENWFYKLETWNNKAADGLKIIVPRDAQQVLIFLAPQTGGDFKTLVDAVRGRPGAFVRASQDLNQATLDRSRLDVFLAAIRKAGPDELKAASPLLARSLAIKFNAACLQKEPALQPSCLMQDEDSLVLSDGHSTSIAEALSSGDSASLIAELSSTPQAGFGYYSPYVGAVMDIVHIMDSLHTARYQYIPALAIEHDDQFSLVLNTPPSFQDPKSVLVAALPAVEPPRPPPLRPVDPDAVYCSEKPDLLLPVDGSPLAFSTAYAHDMVLRLKGKNGKAFDAPVRADAEKGGFIADTTGVSAALLGDTPDGSLHGEWGFMPFDGPQFHLRNTHPEHWEVSADDQQSLIVGRDDTVHVQSPQAACVQGVTVRQGSGEAASVDWKLAQPDLLAVTLPLKHAQPGPMTLLVTQYGKEADAVPLRVFAEAGRIDSFDLYVGDSSGVLKGARLDEVVDLNVDGARFRPSELMRVGGADELSMITSDVQAVDQIRAGEIKTAKVGLKDGRTVNLKISVQPPRPSVALISKSAQPEAPSAVNGIQLADKDELPLGAVLTFSIHAQAPARFSGRESIEIGSADGVVMTTLTFTNGLVLEDAQVALATVDTAKAFTASTFGALQFRIVEDGIAGDWQRLATLVRLPVLHRLKCPAAPAVSCELSGSNLFLIDSLSGDPRFDHAVKIPEGFTGRVLQIPHPPASRLYVKLRDDPSAVDTIALPL
jgi:hypothetical protein